MLTRYQAVLGALAATAMLTGCHNSSDDPGPPAPTSYLRVIHASPDAPNVNVTKDNALIAPNLGYAGVTPLGSYTAGIASLKVDAVLPGGTATVIGPANVPLSANTINTVLAIGKVGSGTLALSSGPVYDPAGKNFATFTSIWRLEAPGVWRIVFDKGNENCDCKAP